jgi:hypothetical protein
MTRSILSTAVSLPRLSIALLLLACIFSGGCVDYPLGLKYTRIQKGMKQTEVESILGKGTRQKPDEVARSPKGPVVEGQEIYKWTNKQGEEIWIGFCDGAVNQTFYYKPSL